MLNEDALNGIKIQTNKDKFKNVMLARVIISIAFLSTEVCLFEKVGWVRILLLVF